MTTPGEMSTLTSVLAVLHAKGQDNELTITKEGFQNEKGKLYKQQELKIIKTYRFEGESDPSEEAIIYLMEAEDGFIGYSLDCYGKDSNHDKDRYAEYIHEMAVENK